MLYNITVAIYVELPDEFAFFFSFNSFFQWLSGLPKGVSTSITFIEKNKWVSYHGKKTNKHRWGWGRGCGQALSIYKDFCVLWRFRIDGDWVKWMLQAFLCCGLIMIWTGKIASGLERETDVNYIQLVSFHLLSVTILREQNHLEVEA